MDMGDGGKKKVMVAIDESECSHYALEWTLQNLPQTIQNSKLYIFTAQPLADFAYLYASSYGTVRMSLFSVLPFPFGITTKIPQSITFSANILGFKI